MKHKSIVLIAAFMFVVFSLTVIAYPMLFSPEAKPSQAQPAMPLEAPAH